LADEKLKASLPGIITAAFSILPHLLAAQILIQNNLISQYYTVILHYCEEEHFPSPPPPMSELIAKWDEDFRTAQHDIETGITSIAGGKTIRQPMKLEDRKPSGSLTGLNIRNGYAQQKASNQSVNSLKPSISPARSEKSEPPSPAYERRPSPSPSSETRIRISSVPSQSSLALAIPNYNIESLTPGSTSPSEFYTPQLHAPAGPRGDYFSRDRNASSSAMATAAAMKKKPPPPPPKRVKSTQGFWVTALYDFQGQGKEDLVFHKGDRIKVVKRTESTDDWWEGELKGIQGSFPANYCEAI
jgi:amphiphysin